MSSQRRQQAVVAAAMVIGLTGWLLWPAPAPPPTTQQDQPPGTVVTFSPALTEIVFAIGAGDRIAAVTDFCQWPPEARELPRVGGVINPNYEQLSRLAPDAVILQGMNERVREYCETRGLAYIPCDLDNLAGIAETMRLLGRRLGVEATAEAAATELEHRLAAVRAAVAGQTPRRVFLCAGRQPDRLEGLMTCGGRSFLSELATLAGGANIFADSPLLYPEPSLEVLTARAPEVIVEFRPGQPEAVAGAADWAALSSLPAVRDRRVVVLTGDHIMLPGPRVVQTAQDLLAAIWPEQAEPAQSP